MKALGYSVHALPRHGLVTLAKHGVNVAPIANATIDDGFRVQRLALQITGDRVSFRHRHGHSSSAACRSKFNADVAAEPAGDLFIDVGDFNEHPSQPLGAHVAFPNDKTLR